MLEKGYVQVYTGNGKGKTTASLGLVLRTTCAGNKAFVGQFMKGQDYSELKAPEFLPGLKIEQFGDLFFVNGKPSQGDIDNAHKGLARMEEVLTSGEYDVVVFDEINTSMFFHLVEPAEVLEVLKKKPEKTEVVLTGRYAPDEIVEYADLVTEMREIKHYYNAGVDSRVGIEN